MTVLSMMVLGMWSRIFRQRTPAPPLVKADLTGKTVIVVGANIGIGLEAARHFCGMSPGRVIIACRSEGKGQEAVTDIRESTGFTPELWLLDLARFSSVAAFAEKFEAEGGRLDYLVLNAAVGMFERRLTVDGFEESLQVNHLACAMLSILLLPRLVETARKHSSDVRVVQVCSGAHAWAKPKTEITTRPGMFEAYSLEENCQKDDMLDRYHLSKLFNVMFTRSLDAHMRRDVPVIADTVDPGYCYSGLRRHFPFGLWVFDSIMQWCLARPAEEGGRQLVFAALAHADDPEKMRGKYITLSEIKPGSEFLYTPTGIQMQESAWEDTVTVLSKYSPKIRPIVDQYLSA